MKKLLFALVAVFAVITSFAASPNLQDITLTSSNGTTLDFYADRSNKVVFCDPNANIPRGGTFYLGSIIRHDYGAVVAKFRIDLPMSYGTKTLNGTITYRNSDGYVSSVTLDGVTYSSGQRTVMPRKR